MKLLNFAIASIVDANTGNGINRQFVSQFGSNKTDFAQHGRDIRANSILALIGKIKASVTQYIENSKATAQARRSSKEVLQMSEHMMKDVGLTYNDLNDLRLGLISLNTLNQRRDQNRNEQDAGLGRLSLQQVSVGKNDLESSNEEAYELAKCA